MNIPEIYLVEPYNCYAPKQKKKHWMQEVEEQALMAKIIAEQMAIQEATAKRTSNTLPPQAPPTAQSTAQAYSGGEGAAGQANTTGGGGQQPRPQFFNPSVAVTASASPTTASSPSTIQFSLAGASDTLQLGGLNVVWNFGDGTTGGGPSPAHTYTTISKVLVQMTASSVYNTSLMTTQALYVTLSAPTVAAAFTVSDLTAPITLSNGYYTASTGDTIQFTDASSNALTWNWNFGSGSNPTSSLQNAQFTYTTASTYTVTEGITGSFGYKSTGQRNIKIV